MPKSLKKSKKSPNQRSLEYMTEQGYLVGKVEQTVPHTFIKRDLFSLFDLVAIRENETVGIQVTSASNITARIHKIEESPILPIIRKVGWRILIQGWRDIGNTPKEVDLS